MTSHNCEPNLWRDVIYEGLLEVKLVRTLLYWNHKQTWVIVTIWTETDYYFLFDFNNCWKHPNWIIEKIKNFFTSQDMKVGHMKNIFVISSVHWII